MTRTQWAKQRQGLRGLAPALRAALCAKCSQRAWRAAQKQSMQGGVRRRHTLHCLTLRNCHGLPASATALVGQQTPPRGGGPSSAEPLSLPKAQVAVSGRASLSEGCALFLGQTQRSAVQCKHSFQVRREPGSTGLASRRWPGLNL